MIHRPLTRNRVLARGLAPVGVGAIALAMLLAGCAGGRGAPPADERGVARLSFESPDGLSYDAAIDRPDPNASNGWGVLLIGGGLGNDLDWTAPGTMVIDGAPTQVTISGESHADAPILAAALVERGFTVMRWSTIARGDPLADQWPERSTPRSLNELQAQARAALAAFRRSQSVEPDRIILLGHSLGAARACTLAGEDPGVAGLILLSPAYFTRRDRMPASFEEAGMLVGAEVVAERNIPCLIILGELDMSRAVDRPGLIDAVGPERATVLVLPGVGHQLGPELDGRIGPLDAGAAEQAAAWAAALRSGR